MSKHIRKILIIGIVEKVNDNKEEFSVLMKLQPKWTDDQNTEKLGKPINVEVFLDDPESFDKYKPLCKTGNILQIEGNLRNCRWQESDGTKKKRMVISITRYDTSIALLPIKKESEMPYLNKVFVLGNCFKATIRSTQNGHLMGIFPLITKKSYKDRNTGQIVNQDEWLDVFVFNERLLANYPAGEAPMENKLVFVEGQIQSGNNPNELKNNITITQRSDNKFFIIDNPKNNGEEKSEESSNAMGNISLDDDLPF
jgi:single-stranded DNA-binding protein